MNTLRRQPIRFAWRAVLALAIVLGGALAGCKSKPPKPAPPPPVILTLNLAASADVNPDAQGRPSPVVVRVYQLKDGAALAARQEFELAPSEQRSVTLKPPPEVRFIGVVVAYRDIRNARWRAQLVVPERSKAVLVNVAHTSVSVTMY